MQPIITTGTGKFRSGLQGMARFVENIVCYIGEQYTRTEIPTYCVTLDKSKSETYFCQEGRDFIFIQQ
jgi:hypothetical protein